MEDINKLLNEARAAAAREAAILREREAKAALTSWDPGEAEAEQPHDESSSSGVGILEVERRQGRWRCYLAGQRIRSGDALEAYINADVGWVLGRLHWARSPHTPPSIRIHVAHPDNAAALGEVELLLPEDTVCRWPDATPPG